MDQSLRATLVAALAKPVPPMSALYDVLSSIPGGELHGRLGSLFLNEAEDVGLLANLAAYVSKRKAEIDPTPWSVTLRSCAERDLGADQHDAILDLFGAVLVKLGRVEDDDVPRVLAACARASGAPKGAVFFQHVPDIRALPHLLRCLPQATEITIEALRQLDGALVAPALRDHLAGWTAEDPTARANRHHAEMFLEDLSFDHPAPGATPTASGPLLRRLLRRLDAPRVERALALGAPIEGYPPALHELLAYFLYGHRRQRPPSQRHELDAPRPTAESALAIARHLLLMGADPKQRLAAEWGEHDWLPHWPSKATPIWILEQWLDYGPDSSADRKSEEVAALLEILKAPKAKKAGKAK